MSARLPPLAQRRSEPLDPLWYAAFPAYWLVMLGYGLFAWLFPIHTVAAVGGFDRAATFGGLIGIAASFLLAGSLIAIFRQKPHLEFWASVAFLVLMEVYFQALYHAVVTHEPSSRPGAAFLPLLFSIFPFVRALVILRGGRMAWPGRVVTALTPRKRTVK